MSKTLRVGRNSLDVVPQPKSSKVTIGTIRLVPPDLATLLKGLYGKVAQVLDVDPLYVSRVARGQCRMVPRMQIAAATPPAVTSTIVHHIVEMGIPSKRSSR